MQTHIHGKLGTKLEKMKINKQVLYYIYEEDPDKPIPVYMGRIHIQHTSHLFPVRESLICMEHTNIKQKIV